MKPAPESDRSPPISRLISLAAIIGIAYGILEGLESFLLSLLPQGLSWTNGNSIDALRYLPVLYLAAYLVIGLVVAGLARLIQRPWWDAVLVAGLVALSGYLAARNQGAFSILSSGMLGLGVGAVAFRAWRKRSGARNWSLVRTLPLIMLMGLVIVGGSFLLARWTESRRLAALPAADRDRPNILLIILDTQRADHLSSYGYHRPTTPHLDSVAREGVLFERAFSPSSWTLPSHASLFTGRLTREHRAGDDSIKLLDDRFPTLAERLGAVGYATAGFVANTYWAARHTGLARGFVHYEDFYGTPGDALQRMALVRELQRLTEWLGAVDIRGRKRAPHINTEFLRWSARIQDRPFFAFLNYMDVHSPYLPPEPYAGRFGPVRREFRPKRLEVGNRNSQPISADERAHRIDRYDESLAYLDAHVGRLMAELLRRGILDRTIVIITSDHGELFGEHGFLEHGKSLYQQETLVPLIIRYPARIPGGSRVTSRVGSIRLAATIADLVALGASPFPGRSLLGEIGRDSTAAIPLVTELGRTRVSGTPAAKGWVRSLVNGRWHFIQLQSGKHELYDLEADPEELNDLAATVEGRAAVERLRMGLEHLTGVN
jgi:arylsulfatase A-like enzyme